MHTKCGGRRVPRSRGHCSKSRRGAAGDMRGSGGALCGSDSCSTHTAKGRRVLVRGHRNKSGRGAACDMRGSGSALCGSDSCSARTAENRRAPHHHFPEPRTRRPLGSVMFRCGACPESRRQSASPWRRRRSSNRLCYQSFWNSGCSAISYSYSCSLFWCRDNSQSRNAY